MIMSAAINFQVEVYLIIVVLNMKRRGSVSDFFFLFFAFLQRAIQDHLLLYNK